MRRANLLLQSFYGNKFALNNAVFWTASLFVSFLNYLYYPVLGRLLDPAPFGETQTIISIFTQAGAFLQVLGLVSIGIITKYPEVKTRETLTNEISRLALYVSVIFLALSVLFSPFLKDFFRFETVTPFFLLGISLLVNVPLSFANAYLQGHNRFQALSTVNILGAVGKLVFAVGLVLIGLETLGAVGGLVIAQLLGLAYSLRLGKGVRHFVATHLRFQKPELSVLRPELPYALMVLATSVTTNLLISFDILVVKHFFEPGQAGLYTGISIISNIVLFITGPFAAVMIPSIKPVNSRAENYRVLKKSLLVTAGVGGAVLAVFLLAPRLVVLVLLGSEYAQYAHYLRGLAVSMFALSISNLLIYYHIGLRHFMVAPTVLAGLVTTLVLLERQHSTMGMVVQSLVTGSLLLLVLLSALMLRYRKETA